MEAEFHAFRSRRNVVGAAEGGKEVIQNILVGQVDDRKTEAHLVSVAVEQIVMADRQIKQMPRLDALRIVVVVFRVRGAVFSPDWT